MSNTQILRELDLNTFNTKHTQRKSKLSQLVEELKRIFSLQNLEKDPFLVYSMNPDLWIQLDLIAYLEPIVSISKDKRLLRAALKEANLEYDPEFGRVRARVDIPRTTLIIRDVDCREELLMILSEFSYKSITHEENNWLLSFEREDQTLKVALLLREFGLKTAIQSTNAYVHLLSKAKLCLEDIAVLPFFSLLTQPTPTYSGRAYTVDELLGLFSKHKSSMPSTMKLLSGMYSVIKETPYSTIKMQAQ